MRHNHKQRKLNRPTAHRVSLLANMASSLIEHEQIVTTLPKAKELKPFVEKLVTLGKNGDLTSRRRAISKTRNEDAVRKIFDILAPRYEERNGGYVRIMKFGHRFGDAAPKAVIEFVDRDEAAKGKKDIARVEAERAAQAEAEA